MGGRFESCYTTPSRSQTPGMNRTAVGAVVETGVPFPPSRGFCLEPQARSSDHISTSRTGLMLTTARRGTSRYCGWPLVTQRSLSTQCSQVG